MFAFDCVNISKIEKIKLMLKEIVRQGEQNGIQAKIMKLEMF